MKHFKLTITEKVKFFIDYKLNENTPYLFNAFEQLLPKVINKLNILLFVFAKSGSYITQNDD